jgi:hypothetical protein
VYYFVLRHSDGAIGLLWTENLEASLLDNKREYGQVNLLGVMSEDEVYAEFVDRFGYIHLEEQYDWYQPIIDPSIYEFISEHAVLDDDRVKLSSRYKASEYTPIKQQALDAALRQQMSLVVQITKTWNHRKPYLYFDLNAGPGVNDDNELGSPMIFNRVAEEFIQKTRRFYYEAMLYEADHSTYLKLLTVLGNDARFAIKNTDHGSLLDELQRRRYQIPFNERKWIFGTIYADPSNATLPWDLLEEMNEVYPHVDVMINIACASYKRTISMAGYQTLADRLPRVKKHWIVRRPFGKHQWSILIGTNWDDYPAWREKNFYPWNDKGIGSNIFEKLVYTPDQLQAKYQPKLFELD